VVLSPVPLGSGGYIQGQTVTVFVSPKPGWAIQEWVGPVYRVLGETATVDTDTSAIIMVAMAESQQDLPTDTPVPPTPTTLPVPTAVPNPVPTAVVLPSPTPTATPVPTDTSVPTPTLVPILTWPRVNDYLLSVNSEYVASGQMVIPVANGEVRVYPMTNPDGDYAQGKTVTLGA